MNNFIYKASTMREHTRLALSEVMLKKKINEALEAASNNGDYWCHVNIPALVSEETMNNLVSDLTENEFKVKVTPGKNRYLTIQWAPEDSKVVFDGEEWT